MTKFPTITEEMTRLKDEISDSLLYLNWRMDVIESLYTQTAWLNESFEEVANKKDDPRAYFHEWSTNLRVITNLFFHIKKEIREEHAALGKLNEELEKMAKKSSLPTANE